MAYDHVYDPESGAHVATIERGKVIDDITGEVIAEVRDGMLFGLDGTTWHCHLDDANGATGPAPMLKAMRRALNGGSGKTDAPLAEAQQSDRRSHHELINQH